MKHFFSTICLFFFSTILFSQDLVTEYKIRNAVPIRKPILSDSINMNGEKFDNSKLLNTTLSLSFDKDQNYIQKVDTSGFVSFTKPEKDYTLQLLSFQLKADQFVKAKIKITSPNQLIVYINKEEKKKKESTEDSIQLAKKCEVSFAFEPERRYEVIIKTLISAENTAIPSLKCEIIKEEKDSLITIQTGLDIKNRYSLDNTVYGNRIENVSLSPNGKYLLSSYSNKYNASKSYSYKTLTETKSGKVLFTNMVRNMRWMPKSNLLYYTVTNNEGVDLITLNPETMEEKVLYSEIQDGYFQWSPNEDYLIYTSNESAPKESGALKRIVTPMDRLPDFRNSSYLNKYDLKTGVSERITFGNHSTDLRDIRYDGKKLIYTTFKEKPTQRPFSVSSVYELDLETLQVDTLVKEDSFLSSAHYSPDGKSILFIGGPEAFNKIGMNCGSHPIPNNYDEQAFIMNISTKEVKAISRDVDPSLSFLEWNRKNNCIYFKAEDKDCIGVYCYNTSNEKWEKIDLEVETMRSFTLSDDASVAAYSGIGISSSTKAYLYNIKKKESDLIADPMKPIMDNIELGNVEEWNFKTEDSTTIYGTICYPPQFDANKKYPLIVYYYGGTSPTGRILEMYYGAHLFASRNYIVYIIQPSGTTGFGQEFSARHVNAWGERTADEIIEGTKLLCKTHSFINDKKIGCLGASYGGFMTMYLQTKTDLFAAAISHAGISNVTSYWGEGYWGFGYNAVAAADSYPWSNPELFTKQGALFNADKIHTPLLLLHGTVDTNVPIGESIQLFNALKILGRPVEFIQIEGENHHVMDYGKRIIWHNTIMAWFAKWLQDAPQWWDELYPERYIE